MHILHVYKDYAPVVGGIENLVRSMAEAQAAAGHQVTVLVTRPEPGPGTDTVEGGIRVIRARRLANLASTPISPGLVRILPRLRPDITHLQAPYPVAEAAWLLGGRHPLVVSYQSDVVRQRVLGRLWAPCLRRLLDQADRILASSPNYVESSPFLRRVRGKVQVLPLGIDPAPFLAADRAAARARYGDGPTLVFVGRLRYYKGVDVLIDALAELPGPRLLVAGVGPEGEALRARAEARGVADRVTWLGDVPDADLPGVYAAGDVFVLPAVARSEAYGLVLVEAMASGLPVLSTELGTGTSWINQDRRTGRVVAPRDAHALAGALRELLADPEGRAAMGAAARERALDALSAERMNRRLLALYAELVPGPTGESGADRSPKGSSASGPSPSGPSSAGTSDRA